MPDPREPLAASSSGPGPNASLVARGAGSVGRGPDAASRCVYRTWYANGDRLERWIVPNGIEYRTAKRGRGVEPSRFPKSPLGGCSEMRDLRGFVDNRRRLPESNRWKAPQGDVSATAPQKREAPANGEVPS